MVNFSFQLNGPTTARTALEPIFLQRVKLRLRKKMQAGEKRGVDTRADERLEIQSTAYYSPCFKLIEQRPKYFVFYQIS